MKLKKTAVFILVFLAIYGFTAVDEAYSDMMDQPGKVSLNVRKVNSEYVTVSIFGQSAAVNIKEIKEYWSTFNQMVTKGLDNTVAEIHDLLGISKEEPDYSVFNTEIL
ncbi:MAG: hypothetical protein PHV71_04655 [Eubacteriales bacterium]|nr:hypothetical protein [Eubacteriales bacterium]MDD4629882.1 hypothetical protein [Eubacteriales bacterium]